MSPTGSFLRLVDRSPGLLIAIEALPSFEIDTVRAFHAASPKIRMDVPGEVLQALSNAGLATPASAFDAVVYEPNKTCEAFIALGLDVRSKD